MFDKFLAAHAAPTLAGVKPASLFAYWEKDASSAYQAVQAHDHMLAPRGIRITVLRRCPRTGRLLVYVYRKNWLHDILHQKDNLLFLQQYGYRRAQGTAGFLEHLAQRMCVYGSFPHEIGVFLGYPLEDVVGFIENNGENYTCRGLWKAYGNPVQAQKKFTCFRKCTELYKRRFAGGSSIIQLTVAV